MVKIKKNKILKKNPKKPFSYYKQKSKPYYALTMFFCVYYLYTFLWFVGICHFCISLGADLAINRQNQESFQLKYNG